MISGSLYTWSPIRVLSQPEEPVTLSAATMKVTVVSSDPISFMRNDGETWDAVIQLIPPPSTLSVNRFYTVEYFRLVREHLSADGVFMCTPMPYYNYAPESYRKGFSPLYNALADVFRHIPIIPGSSLYVLASDLPLTLGCGTAG